MNIIIPMAGRGTRLRPHTLTIPKPLIKIAGKPIVQRIVEDLASSYHGTIDEVAFVIGDFGREVEEELLKVAESVGAKGKIFYQQKALGTAHAVYCAAESLTGNCMIAFSDTLFKADFSFDENEDGYIWCMRVPDPKAYGVVNLNDAGYITEFVEKPETFVSDLAVVGIYYFKDGDGLKAEIKQIIDNDVKDKGEYQLTTALENLKNSGLKFKPGTIEEWLDCGNKDSLVNANQRILEFNKTKDLTDSTCVIENSVIIQPCFIGKNAKIHNSVVGPYVSIGEDSVLEHVVISNSIIQNKSILRYGVVQDSMVGSSAAYESTAMNLNIGDYSTLKN
ncbi:MAG TPA: sugar phosphate nucleotidyltransferase [Saprospiraceae bacterium]|nr:NTP transferase domain-containing protein [Saprospiraceae bacterium]HMZ74168.1 sugar phosphate nucleotidyltransferase [Saprospiraceae bacterium]HNO37429.1 sugar phosphate nucleotidyltransferase [Saprospiraceae bacterium]